MTDKVNNVYSVRSIVDVVPKRLAVFFSVVFYGSMIPTGSCSDLVFATTTQAQSTMASMPYTFPATMGVSWPITGGTRFEATCTFAVTETLPPDTRHFLVEFGTPIYDFMQWGGSVKQPQETSGNAFHMTNMYWLQPTNLILKVQVSVALNEIPSVTCSSDLMQYSPPTTQPSTTKAPTTQPPTSKAPTTQPPTTKAPTTQPPTTKAPTTQQPTTIVQTTKQSTSRTPDVTSIPVDQLSDWPIGNGNRRMNGRCSFEISERFLEDQLKVNLTLSVPTFDYLDWSWNGITSSNNGNWYYRSNKWIQEPNIVHFDFQASYTGDGPLTGTCIVNAPSTETTTAPPVTTKQTTKAQTTADGTTKQATTKPPGTTVQTTTVKTGDQFDYNDVIKKSIWFYRAQRSGDLPEVVDDPVPWRGDSALYDGDEVGIDLTGGWYDAGDWVKFNFPISSATAVLAWGLVQWKDAYQAAGQYSQMLDCIKWSLDFFLKCWRPNENTLYGQVGNGGIDHSRMMRPEDMTPSNMHRPAYKVTTAGGGSDLAGSMVAALAAGSIAFKDVDSAYSTQLLNSAKSLYEFSDRYRGFYTTEITDAGNFYPSSGFKDELVYAAAMLYKATRNNTYLTDAESKYDEFGFDYQSAWAFDWSDKIMGAKVLLFEATGKSKYSRDVQTFLGEWREGGSVQYTPGGLAWRAQWGSNRYAANTAFIALMAADMGIDTENNRNWAKGQIHYMLGDNPRQSSYVVGFGNNPPRQPHHKSSTCEAQPAPCDWSVFSGSQDNAHVLYGALVGGPDSNDSYKDDRTDYIKAEVTCDYNAGFQSSVAGLVHFELQS